MTTHFSAPSVKRNVKGRVCVMVHGWPRLSMTFVAQELVGLENEGLDLWVATYGVPDAIRHPIHEKLKASIHRLPGPGVSYRRFVRAWLKVCRKPGFSEALALFRREFKRDRKKRTSRAFMRGVILAGELPADIRVIYAHFINSATTVARYASIITGVPLAASAHARDIWTGSESDLIGKLEAMRWCATCTSVGADRLRSLSDQADKIRLIYHGLSFDRFPSDPPLRERPDGSHPAATVQLLSVGRAVEKKGFDVLLEALAALPDDLHWRWTHVGTGKIIDSLLRRRDELGLGDRTRWLGARDQKEVFDLYRGSDLFILPCREASDGDRDGLPNVLMEAQSQALACLSTEFSEVPELIRSGETGVLVPPGDPHALAKELERLIRSPLEREKLGMAGFHRVRTCFEAESGIREIATLLRQTME